MGIDKQHGFTIIETMLFLGISGILAIGILVGAGVSIGQQRYRDSVNSLKSYIQQQYNEAGSIVNSRASDWSCNTTAAVLESPGAGGEPRGTSDCVIMGRYITTNDKGTVLTSSNVVGYKNSVSTAVNDIDELTNNYQINVSPVDQDIQEVKWGAQIVQQKKTVPMTFSMLIIRSPLSGTILAFTKDSMELNPKALISVANTTQEQHLCVNADAGSFVGKRMEVRINANPTNQSAVSIPTESESVCD